MNGLNSLRGIGDYSLKGLYKFPDHTFVNRKIDSSKIFNKLNLKESVKTKFNKKVKCILWLNELSEATLNIETSQDYPVIQIFRVIFKESFDLKMLELIDRAIGSTIIYEIKADNSCFYAASYKSDKPFFITDLIDTGKEFQIPFVINTSQLYEELLKSIVPVEIRPDENFEAFMERAGQYIKKIKEAEKLEKKMNREKQFNRRVEMNHELRKIMEKIEKLARVNL